MGLTIHYDLKHKGDEKSARSLLERLHQATQDLPFQEVHELVDLKGEACDAEQCEQGDPLRWLLIQSAGHLHLKNTHRMGNGEMGDRYLSVMPTRIIAFSTWPGEGCEEANFGLCRYPATLECEGKRMQTKMSGWRWRSF